jgi:hypothetical protein
MYVAMLLTDWSVITLPECTCSDSRSSIHRNVVSTEQGGAESEEIVYIGRSETAMWMRVVSSWVCMLLYMWSLLAPVFMPDR